MAASSHELALRYLLELSSDIRFALLLDRDGGLIAAAPQPPPGRLASLAADLSREAGALFGAGGEEVEIDAACEGGAVFLIRSGEGAMVCLTDRSVLPGLIFYDMHAVLTDIDRAAGNEARRVGVAER
jgi:predicted regulator of Ras-like GTPase activity (Roadblock/LC7/MglB family)